MSLRHALLGLLGNGPMSGYEMTKTFASSLAFTWSAQHGQIYPELKRLSGEGLIRQVEEGPRGRKRYALTPEGKKEVRRWLTQTEPNRTERDEASLRVFFLWQLPPKEAIAYLERERAQSEAVLATFEEIADHIEFGEHKPPWGTLPVELGIRFRQARLAWIDDAIAHFRKEARKKR